MSKTEIQILIESCLQQIEDKLGWGGSKNWHSGVFDELSERIQKETNVLLSTTTLKRVWGKISYDSKPSTSTLNTLSQFIGYINWRDFKSKHQTVVGIIDKKSETSKRTFQTKLFFYASLLAIFFISLFSLVGKKEAVLLPEDLSKIEFRSTVVSQGLPNSVVFDFNLMDINSDSIYIQQFWDPNQTIKLKRGQTQATGQYYYPGYFRAKLLVEGEIIKEHDLFIKSNGWLGTIDYKPIPKYINSIPIVEGVMKLPEFALTEIENIETPVLSSFHYINELDSVSGDNFNLKTRIRNTYNDKWAVCQKTSIVIVGTKSALIIPFAIPGCVSELGVMLSEKFLNGKEHDLSLLGVDFTEFRDIEFKVEDKHLKVFVDNIQVYNEQYEKTIGKIAGVRFRFLGSGEVDYLKLMDINTNRQTINDDFN